MISNDALKELKAKIINEIQIPAIVEILKLYPNMDVEIKHLTDGMSFWIMLQEEGDLLPQKLEIHISTVRD